MQEALFQSWSAISRTVVVGVAAYAILVVLLRASGKRTLSKMNAFDLVVTVALGSTLATILLSKDVALAEGVTALLVLVAMQCVVAWLSVRSKTVRRLARSEPRLLVRRGQLLTKALKEDRLSHDDISEVDAVILETDGRFSVVASTNPGASAMQPVRGVGGTEQ